MYSINRFSGKLKLGAKLDDMVYGVVEKTKYDIRFWDITQLFREILKSPSPYIIFNIKTKDGITDIFLRGKLKFSHNKLCDWYIDGYCISDFLFNNTGMDVDVYVEHFESKYKLEVAN